MAAERAVPAAPDAATGTWLLGLLLLAWVSLPAKGWAVGSWEFPGCETLPREKKLEEWTPEGRTGLRVPGPPAELLLDWARDGGKVGK